MKTNARRISLGQTADRDSKLSRSRSGTMMVWSIWVFLAMLMIVACFFNVMWLSCARAEARRHAESAVIVGGHAFLSDDLLRPRQQPFEYEGRAVRCRAAAVEYIRQAGNSAVIPTMTQEDVELTPSFAESSPGNSGTMQRATGVPHEIRVSFGKHQPSDQLRMFFGGLAGSRNARLGVTAAARIEHSPVGFQPGRNLTIPVLPLAIMDPARTGDTLTDAGGLWSEQIESGKGSDNLSWNPEQHSVEYGPDGLPEITLTLTPNSSGNGPDGLVPLNFAAGSATGSIPQTIQWMRQGVAAEDLKSLGVSALSFPSEIPVAGLSKQVCAEIAAYLQTHQGQAFIVCLCNPTTSNTTSQNRSSNDRQSLTVNLHRPVAARVMAVAVSASGDLRIRLQPCVLITSTAMMSESPQIPLNRYIYSVRLSD